MKNNQLLSRLAFAAAPRPDNTPGEAAATRPNNPRHRPPSQNGQRNSPVDNGDREAEQALITQ
ncbi:hypothetical protein Kim5_CH03473 [Rhizobium sp. Kim5]|nr:hypothetical protein Kim5_CH03473 [Rhizobium sp. Kim5]